MPMNRIHPSWEFMRPNENEKHQDFRFEEYYKRISANKKLNHIPKTIFDQDFNAFMKKIAYSIVYVNTSEELQRNIYK